MMNIIACMVVGYIWHDEAYIIIHTHIYNYTNFSVKIIRKQYFNL